MTSVTQYDVERQKADEELRLWSDYVMAMNTVHRLEYEWEHAWRFHVTSNVPSDAFSRAHHQWCEAYEKKKAAFKAWQCYAYPMVGRTIPAK
jgi:hypothetical protein